ncbi:hypothetical protein AB0H76_06945 [Nocardia sp. NPDC050712]|uniref:hypothetical protein n=1 Tax=Nocardia sp. NPDC050712 TaxID=3155518 RepID=UPI0033FE258D
MYGSKTSLADKATAAANSVDGAAAQAWFEARGWDFAEDLLGHYLGNNDAGFIYEISDSNFKKAVETDDVKGKIESCLGWIKSQARENPEIGVKNRDISTGWVGAGPTENEDVENALGHFDVAVGSDTTVYEADGGFRAEITYKVYIHENYNFEKLKPKFGSLNIGVDINNEMRQLEEAGWARSFRVHGETAGVEHWSGMI